MSYAKIPNRRNLSEAEINVINRLVLPNDKRLGLNGKERKITEPDINVLSRVYRHTAGKVTDSRNMIQVLPQLGLVKKILITSIISPDDLTCRGVSYSSETKNIDPALTSALTTYIQNFFDNEFKINEMHYPALESIMFSAGSYAKLILPESTIDYAINGDTNSVSMESLINIQRTYGLADGWMKPMGFIRSKSEIAQRKNTKVSVTSTFESYISGFNRTEPANKSIDEYTITFESLKDRKVRVVDTDNKPHDLKLNASRLGSIRITDNYNILKLPILTEKLRSDFVSKTLTASSEARKPKSTLEEIQNKFYKKRSFKNTPMLTLLTPNQLGVRSTSHPVEATPPPESIIVISSPGNPNKKNGYLILIDPITNEFVKASDRTDYYENIRTSFINSEQSSSQLLEMANVAMNGLPGMSRQVIDELNHIFNQSLERDILESLNIGSATGTYVLSRPEEVNRIMFQRSCAGKNTTVLYVPAELMVYMAFDYNEYGVGKSLLEDSMVLASLMATLLFADVHGAVKNATGTRKIILTVPEDDEEVDDTAEFALSEWQRLNAGQILAPSFNPVDITDSLQNAGLTVSVKGSPYYPEVEFDVETREGSHKTVSPELHDLVKERLYNAWGITTDVVSSHTDADYATSIVQNKYLLLQRVMEDQRKYNPFITELVRLYSVNSGIILDELSRIIKENKGSIKDEFKKSLVDDKDDKKEIDEDKLIAAVISEYINTLTVKLPSPITKKITEQIQELTDYGTFVDTCLPYILSEEMFDSTKVGNLFDSVASARANIKAKAMREYMAKHNIAPELMIFTTSVETKDSPAKEYIRDMETYTDGILKVLESYLEKSNIAATARRKRLEKINAKFDANGDEGDGDDGDGFPATGDDGAGTGEATDTPTEPTDDGAGTQADDDGQDDASADDSSTQDTLPPDPKI